MLYDRWREVVRDQGSEVALWDVATDRRWRFGELERWAEAHATGSVAPRVVPRGSGAEFIRDVLVGWRQERLVCPLEEGQGESTVPKVPPGIVHLKATSATTGAARWIGFRGEQLAADADQIRQTMGLRPDWPNLAGISLVHSYGFSNLVLPLLLQGVPLILCGSGMPEAIRRGARLASGVTLPGVPVLWRQWLEAGGIVDQVRLAISAGSALPVRLEQEVFEECGLKVHNFYGASECGGIAYDRSSTPRDDDALVGEPMAGVQLSIGGSGLLEVRSEAVGEGYWPTGDVRLGDGIYRTSDLAEMGDGKVFLCGRQADLIHVAGRKVAPEAIERVLMEHPLVRECLVLGLPAEDDLRGDKITVVVVVAGGVVDGALVDFAHSRLPAWQVPRRWEYVRSLETSERGKMSRKLWRDRLSAGE